MMLSRVRRHLWRRRRREDGVRDELDVLIAGSGYVPPWRDALDVLDVDHDVTVVTASVDCGIDPDADPDKHGNSVKANPS